MKLTKLFAGAKLRALRERSAVSQAVFAARLGVSVSYLSQLESDTRPVTVSVLMALSREFQVDLREFDQDSSLRLLEELREAFADPLFAQSLPEAQELKRLATQFPAMAERIGDLYRAYRRVHERLQIVDEALDTQGAQARLLPWEQVRDYFHEQDNYIAGLDEAAEALSLDIAARYADGAAELTKALLRKHQVTLRMRTSLESNAPLKVFDRENRTIWLDSDLNPQSRNFLLAHQLALLEFSTLINTIADDAKFESDDARQILQVGLANYAAGALLMPYALFAEAARNCRHDVEQLARQFDVSFEQVCHRLSTLQRPHARGVPFFFLRVDMAGNITKRHSATRLSFGRYGGACPLWIVHSAAATPGQIMVQLAEMPDGVKYISMARGLVKESGRYQRPDRRYAVALGCEASYADQFIYASAVDLSGKTPPTPIGVSCRICPRQNCVQRAFPPADQRTLVNLDRRDVVPYTFGRN